MTGLSLLDISLKAVTPLRIEGVGIDVYRDWAGRIVIPATMLKGQTRNQVWRLASALAEPACDPADPCAGSPCVVCRVFGSHRHEGAVVFADLRTAAIPIRIDRPRTARSRTRGVNLSAEARQMLLVPAGAQFEGLIHHRLSSSETQPMTLLIAGLRAIRRIGVGAALGWGRCEVSIRGASITASVFKLNKPSTD